MIETKRSNEEKVFWVSRYYTLRKTNNPVREIFFQNKRILNEILPRILCLKLSKILALKVGHPIDILGYNLDELGPFEKNHLVR